MTLKIQLPSTKLIKGNTSQLPRYSYIKQIKNKQLHFNIINLPSKNNSCLLACLHNFPFILLQRSLLLRTEERFITFKTQSVQNRNIKQTI
jgi:hypothetical protein